MPTTLVFDVQCDVIHPVRARAGQVLVVRGEEVAGVRRGTTRALAIGRVSASAVVALVARGVLQRRGPVPRAQTA